VLLSLFVVTLVAAVSSLADRCVDSAASGRIEDVESAPASPVAIVPGAGVRPDGSLSHILEDRLIVASELYEGGKVKKILVSGDHGTKSYDEPAAMAAELEHRGVARRDVFLDHAGFDTYATLYRARHVFGVRSALIVTQEFHLTRAVYLARAFGMDAVGVRADRRPYERGQYYSVRERAARIKAVVAVGLALRPCFLGAPIPIEGDGALTRD
jgi:SanA protein